MKKLIILLFVLSSLSCSKANIVLPKIFNDNMVLQREIKNNIWGKASPNEPVMLEINNKKYQATADNNGDWMLTIDELPVGGPYTMKVKGEKGEVTLKNILSGDVWVCSGQSNMEWIIKRFHFAQEEAKNAQYKNIRLFTVPRDLAYEPKEDFTGGEWEEATGENIMDFSAVGYFFGRYIHQEMNVPIGLVSSSWGGTNVEAWTSKEALSSLPDFTSIMNEWEKEVKENGLSDKNNEEQEKLKAWQTEHLYKGPGMEEKWYLPETDVTGWQEATIPAKFSDLDMKKHTGAVWFRTEFDLPVQFWNQILDLRLGKIDDYNQVWVNGTKIGEAMGKDKWIFYDIPKEILKPKDNVLVIRVFNFSDDGGFISSADHLNFYRKGNQIGFIFIGGKWKYKKGYESKPLTPPAVSRISQAPNSNPSSLFNAMIHPMLKMKIKGAIWYQGESNASRAYQYRTTFPNMINDWRKQWGNRDFPFLFVQLANFRKPGDEPGESEWAELREAQNKALALPNTGSAVIIDIGEADNIHPSNKQDVGKRLGMAALRVAYGKDLVSSGPTYKSMSIHNENIEITFDNIGSGLLIKDRYSYPKEFAIAGEDKKFYWASAHIINDSTISVSCPEVKKPIAVRYAWADNPDEANLYNKEGLPASPFRTDNWDGITIKEKYTLEK